MLAGELEEEITFAALNVLCQFLRWLVGWFSQQRGMIYTEITL